MIPVAPQPEPYSFNANVRQPGARFLASNPNPTSREFQKKNYWKKSLNDLHTAYRGICAYTCVYFTHGSVDHFLPKSEFPRLAYEWNNYRLATSRVNSHKGNSTDVLDPFLIKAGLFVLDFPSCLVRPADGLSDVEFKQVIMTIEVLKLNEDDFFVQDRCDLMLNYADGKINLDFLLERYPFLASEIVRQNIQSTVSDIFKRRSL